MVNASISAAVNGHAVGNPALLNQSGVSAFINVFYISVLILEILVYNVVARAFLTTAITRNSASSRLLK